MSFFQDINSQITAASFADLTVRLAAGNSAPLLELGGITDFEFTRTTELGEQREGGRAISHTHGSTSYSASMSIAVIGYHALMTAFTLAASSRRGKKLTGMVPFNAQIAFSPLGEDRICKWRMKGCRIIEDGVTATDSTDAQVVTLTMKPLEISYVDAFGVESIPT